MFNNQEQYKQFLADQYYKLIERLNLPPAMIGSTATGKSGVEFRRISESELWFGKES